eukprot:15336635-Ditylum_brightwellii.AAC.1
MIPGSGEHGIVKDKKSSMPKLRFASTSSNASGDGDSLHCKDANITIGNDSSNSSNNVKHSKITCIKVGCDKIAMEGCIFHACRFCCGMYRKPINQFLGGTADVCLVHIKKKKDKQKKQKKNSKLNIRHNQYSSAPEKETENKEAKNAVI